MKIKNVLLICSLSLVMVLGGCGKAQTETVESLQEEPVVETVEEPETHGSFKQEETQDEVAQSEENLQTEEPEIETEEAPEVQEEETTENETEESPEDEKAEAIAAYDVILKANPAINGTPIELQDASFGYEQNQKLFGDHIDSYAILDIDQDGIPELMALSMINFRWTPMSVYTFTDGNVKLLRSPLEEEAHGTFELCCTANGFYNTYICEMNHIHNVWKGTNPMGEEEVEETAFALENGVLTQVECSVGESENATYFSDVAKDNTGM